MRVDRLVFFPKPPGRPLADAVGAVERVVQELLPRLAERLAAPGRAGDGRGTPAG